MSKASQESDQQVSDEQGPRAYLGVQPTLANVEAWMALKQALVIFLDEDVAELVVEEHLSATAADHLRESRTIWAARVDLQARHGAAVSRMHVCMYACMHVCTDVAEISAQANWPAN